ncbi:Protein of unknown function [Cotesia congregata]|uniref:Uncharacterized protein n=1 Tax=Cotesia congregata TaxID=51543 RepID=A0A8J2HA59_COTCN|nr:Protein of unknown function [Cotesia congregata]
MKELVINEFFHFLNCCFFNKVNKAAYLSIFKVVKRQIIKQRKVVFSYFGGVFIGETFKVILQLMFSSCTTCRSSRIKSRVSVDMIFLNYSTHLHYTSYHEESQLFLRCNHHQHRYHLSCKFRC